MQIPETDTYGFRPRIVCKDGFSMSVQASKFHYCTPRIDTETENYSAFEVGYPSATEELLMPYIDGNEDAPTDTVYGYVPRKVIEQIVEKHGGMV